MEEKEMTGEDKDMLLDAVDVVCLQCVYCTERRCKRCPVRKTVEDIQKEG